MKYTETFYAAMLTIGHPLTTFFNTKYEVRELQRSVQHYTV